MMVGAVLTQNTAWSNVEKALAMLKQTVSLTAENLLNIDESSLAQAIRSAGYFNIKAQRLRHLCHWIVDNGGLDAIGHLPTNDLRGALLAINGIGPETADDILLYAFDRPVFVIDTYTRRLFSRLGLCREKEPYESLRLWFQLHLKGAQSEPDTVQLFNEYHALIVNHAKDFCKKKPTCTTCCLQPMCAYGREA